MDTRNNVGPGSPSQYLVPKDSTYQIKYWVSRRSIGQSRGRCNQASEKKKNSGDPPGYCSDGSQTMSGM